MAVLLLVAMGMAGTAEVSAATAPWKPDKSIEIIVGTGPGGGQDKTARTLNRLLVEKHLVDVAVTVVNKPGGGGAVDLSQSTPAKEISSTSAIRPC